MESPKSAEAIDSRITFEATNDVRNRLIVIDVQDCG